MLIIQRSNAVFRALADETRRDILKLLRERPRTSGDIASQFGSSWPTISRHLAVLRAADLVVTERHGQEITYELNTTVFEALVQHLMGWAPRARATTKAEGPQAARGLTSHRRGIAARDSMMTGRGICWE